MIGSEGTLGRGWDDVPERVDRAELELEQVHRRTLAELLCQAARRTAGRLRAAYASLLPPLLDTWRRRARRQLVLLARDGWDFEGQELLAELLVGRRPAPELLVAVALDLWSSPEGLLAYGQVLLSGGHAAEAQRVYAEALGLDAGGELPWRLREGLAAAWEAQGRDRVALGCLTATFGRRGVGAGPLASGLFLALEVGDGARAEDLARRVDDRFQPGSRRLLTCARSLAARRAHLRPGAWAPPTAVARLFTELHAGGGATARLCRGFVAAPVGGQA